MFFEGGASEEYEGGDDEENPPNLSDDGAETVKTKSKKKKKKKKAPKTPKAIETQQTKIVDDPDEVQAAPLSPTNVDIAPPKDEAGENPPGDSAEVKPEVQADAGLVIEDIDGKSVKSKRSKKTVKKKKTLKKKVKIDDFPEEIIQFNDLNLNEFQAPQEEQVDENKSPEQSPEKPAEAPIEEANITKKAKKGAKSSAARRQQTFKAEAGDENNGPAAFQDEEGEFKPDIEAEEYSPSKKKNNNLSLAYEPEGHLLNKDLDYSPNIDGKSTKSKKKKKAKKGKKSKKKK